MVSSGYTHVPNEQISPSISQFVPDTDIQITMVLFHFKLEWLVPYWMLKIQVTHVHG